MADSKKLSEGERLSLVQNAFINKLNQVLDMVPGYRGYRRGVENVINMAQGNPSNYSAADYARDLGYSMVPFYGAYDDYINDREQDWTRNAVEAALLGIPVGAVGLKALNGAVKNPKGGFVVNPAYKEPMTKAQKEATDQAIKEWNRGVAINKRLHSTRPEDIPAPVEYEQKALNQINDYLSNQYKFTPKVSNAMGMPVPNDNIVTRAILPEGVEDAGFLRHNPMMSNYDAIFRAANQNVSKFAKEGKLKSGKPYSRLNSDPRYEGQYIIEYRTKDGDYRGQTDRTKRDMLLKLEEMFPGFLDAMSNQTK